MAEVPNARGPGTPGLRDPGRHTKDWNFILVGRGTRNIQGNTIGAVFEEESSGNHDG
ncbi:hypothetical protein P7K49_018655, partial [Saguinus oedipus]